MDPRRGRITLTVGVGLAVGLVVGAMALGPASAHFDNNVNHLYGHFKEKVNRTVVTETAEAADLDSDTFETVIAECPEGLRVIGGGGDLVGVDILPEPAGDVALQASHVFQGASWYVSGREMDNFTGDWTVRAYAICTDL
jgi:hypothetical protein